MVFKAPEYGDLGFFTEFRITVLASILRKFLKNLYITISTRNLKRRLSQEIQGNNVSQILYFNQRFGLYII